MDARYLQLEEASFALHGQALPLQEVGLGIRLAVEASILKSVPGIPSLHTSTAQFPR